MPGSQAPQAAFRQTDRRSVIARRYLQGETQAAIARDLDITPTTVSQDLQAIRQLWLESMIRNFDQAKAQELAKLDLAESEAWEAWSRSKDNHETTVQQRIGESLKVSRTVTGQTGDPRFLQMVLQCIDKRCAILGLNAPARFEVNWDALTDTQMERLARGEPMQNVLGHPTPGPMALPPVVLSSDDYAYPDS